MFVHKQSEATWYCNGPWKSTITFLSFSSCEQEEQQQHMKWKGLR